MNSWSLIGSYVHEYGIGVDDTATSDGKRTAFIKSLVPRPAGYGTLMQTFKADAYRNKRLRLTAAVKTQDVSEWIGLWMRIDKSTPSKIYNPDTMRGCQIASTADWGQYEVVLDVPEDSSMVAFGLLLHGSSQAWLNDVRFEEVAASKPE